MGGKGCDAFEQSLQYWTKDDALKLDVLEKNESTLNFNVVRCRYSEMYRELGIPELGAVFCDFRYEFPSD